MNDEVNCKKEELKKQEDSEHKKKKNEGLENENNSPEPGCKEVKDNVELEEEIVVDILEEKVDSLQEKLQDIEDEKNSIYRKAQRLKADFVNFRKRTAKEKMGIGIQAKIELICEILPVLDNFERALNIKSADEEFKKGVEMIYKQLINTLRQEGLTKIAAEGEEFDHRYHEAICQVEDTDKESGVITEEIEKGYIFEERIVRPAKVKVAK